MQLSNILHTQDGSGGGQSDSLFIAIGPSANTAAPEKKKESMAATCSTHFFKTLLQTLGLC